MVKAGDIVKVKVMEVDEPRKRIGLSVRMEDQPGEKVATNSAQRRNSSARPRHNQQKQKPPHNNVGSMGALLEAALKKK